MSDLNLTINDGSGVYLAITETPAVVTLSQPVISGALSSTVTVANTVTVALDANSLSALENVTVTVGAAVSISNFPSSQVVSVSNFPTNSSVTVANFPSVTTVTGTVALDSASLLALENITVTVGSSVALAAGSAQIGSVTVANLPATQTVQGTVTVGSLPSVSGSVTVNNFPATQTVQGTVTVGALPAISGSVTVNNFPLSQTVAGTVTIGNFPATQTVAGTVTANVVGKNLGVSDPLQTNGSGAVKASLVADSQTQVCDDDGNPYTIANPFPVSGTVTAVLSFDTIFNDGGDRLNIGLGAVAGTDPANWLKVDGGNVPISGTVTASLSKPTWTDYSGTITQAETAVTAISTTERSYLLVQVTTGQMFLNIGATATTLNSVYFSAGQGFAWETTVPQGIVSIISSVTGTNYVLKDG